MKPSHIFPHNVPTSKKGTEDLGSGPWAACCVLASKVPTNLRLKFVFTIATKTPSIQSRLSSLTQASLIKRRTGSGSADSRQ